MRINWKYKAILQQTFSHLPFGASLNYFFQRHISKNLPINDEKFSDLISLANANINIFRQNSCINLDKAIFYEFGTGWDLVIPLAYYSFGVNRQILIDIKSLLRQELINDAIDKFQRWDRGNSAFLRRPTKYLQAKNSLPLTLKNTYGIEYKAPCDAMATGLSSECCDYITSVNTLEHIPETPMRLVLRECYRLLTKDGLMSFRIDYQDHYAYFDQGISVYNFLRYPETTWAIFNPPLHYQNRLRHSDFLRIFEREGFDVVDANCVVGSAEDLKLLEQFPLDKRFGGYSLKELSIRSSHIVLRKREEKE